MGGRGLRLIGAAALLALAACDLVPPEGVTEPPPAPVAPPPPPPSAESEAIRAYYAKVEQTLLSQGLLRIDPGDRDGPFTARQLAANFMAIALYDELVAEGGNYVARPSASELRRWGGPIRLRAVFGDSVPEDSRRRDMADVAAYAQRLSGITGVPVTLTDGPDANFDILFLNEDERRAVGPRVRMLVPNISSAAVNTIQTMSRDTYCMVFAFSEGRSPVYTRALALVRAEHPATLRLACIHEEMAQAMGLPNDSPMARPSIFNDDEEFALLTRHDELLLRILYDPRLRPGMKADEARPIVRAIAEELVGGSS